VSECVSCNNYSNVLQYYSVVYVLLRHLAFRLCVAKLFAEYYVILTGACLLKLCEVLKNIVTCIGKIV